MFGVRTALIVLGFVLITGCGSSAGNESPTVGGPCEDDTDCVTRCQSGDSFPNGLCTRQCSANTDCPGNTVCAEGEEGGLCLLACSSDASCRGGYHCGDVELEAGDNKALACTAD